MSFTDEERAKTQTRLRELAETQAPALAEGFQELVESRIHMDKLNGGTEQALAVFYISAVAAGVCDGMLDVVRRDLPGHVIEDLDLLRSTGFETVVEQFEKFEAEHPRN